MIHQPPESDPRYFWELHMWSTVCSTVCRTVCRLVWSTMWSCTVCSTCWGAILCESWPWLHNSIQASATLSWLHSATQPLYFHWYTPGRVIKLKSGIIWYIRAAASFTNPLAFNWAGDPIMNIPGSKDEIWKMCDIFSRLVKTHHQMSIFGLPIM